MVVHVMLGGVAKVVMPNVSVLTRMTAAPVENATVAVHLLLGQPPEGAMVQEVVVVVVMVVLVMLGGMARVVMRGAAPHSWERRRP
jgi:hypothetical protein